MERNNLYIYCITYHQPAMEMNILPGHNKQPVYTIIYENLAAYVSDTTYTYIEAKYENLQCHENVIRGLMEKSDILPMRFSTICKDKESVIEMLQRYYPQFIKNLDYIAGKVELGIKVFFKLDFEKEDERDKELLKVPREYMRKRYERYCSRQSRIDEILYSIEQYHKNLEEIAVGSSYSKPLKNNLIFNASYLVEAEKQDSFEKVVLEMKKNNPAYKILYSGPWPAYHFVNIVREGEENG